MSTKAIFIYKMREKKICICPNCGSEVNDGSLFCDVCGTRISGERNTPKDIQNEIKQEQIEELSKEPVAPTIIYQDKSHHKQEIRSSSNKNKLVVIVGISLIILITGGWYYYSNQTSTFQTKVIGTIELSPETQDNLLKKRVDYIIGELFNRSLNKYTEYMCYSSDYYVLFKNASELSNKNDEIPFDYDPWFGKNTNHPTIRTVNVEKMSDNKVMVELLFKPSKDEDITEPRTLFLIIENNTWVIDDFKEEPYYSSVKGYLKKYIEENQNKPIIENEEDNSVDDAISNENERENENNAIITESKYDEDILIKADNMPEFADGGMKGLMIYLREAINYPPNAKASGIEGRVIVQFIINLDGSISDAHVLRGVNQDLDKEALRVINSMPKWKPGTNKGENVRVRYTIPVNFRLN